MNTHLPVLSLENAPSSTWHIGEDIRITHGIYPSFPFPSEFHFRDFIVVYLTRGSISGKCNGVKTHFTAPCMITVQPSNVLEFGEASSDVEAITLSFSPAFSDRLNFVRLFELNRLLLERPSLQLDDEMQRQMDTYIERVISLGRNPQNPFQNEALLHVTLAFFYGVGYHYYQISHSGNRAQQIVSDFLNLVDRYGAEEHFVDFYANHLHLSSKYLQRVVRESTGRTVYAWIEDNIINRAKLMLTENRLTLQQIAAELHFCDHSYFGAYFRRVTGMTPRQYRIETLKHTT